MLTNNKNQKVDKKTILGITLTVCAAICWALSGACGQYLFAHGIEVKWLTAVRMLVSAVVIISYLTIKNGKKAFAIFNNKMDVLQLIVFAICGLMLCQYTYFLAISYSNAGTATVLQYLAPMLVLIVVCIRLKRLPKISEAIGIVLALSGTFLMATHGSINNMALSTKGLFWGIVSAIFYMSYSLLPEKIIPKYGSLTIIGFGMLIGGIIWSIYIGLWNYAWVDFSWQMYLALGEICLLGTAFAYVCCLQSISLIGPVKTSMIATLEPVMAVIISAIWLNTSFTGYDLLGLIFIVIMVLLLAKK